MTPAESPIVEARMGWIDRLKELNVSLGEANALMIELVGEPDGKEELGKEPETTADKLGSEIAEALRRMGQLSGQLATLQRRF